jgi:hypothetical protein
MLLHSAETLLVLCGCETWALALTEEDKLQVYRTEELGM